MTAFAIAACQNQANQPSNDTISTVSSDVADCRTIEHKMGETEICGQPQRIVVFGPYLLELLLALTIQPVGFADHNVFHRGDFTHPSQQIPYLGSRITQPIVNVGDSNSPSIEAILKAQPDLILSSNVGDTAQYQTLSEIAPTLALQYDQVEENLKTIAKAVNRPDQSDQMLVDMEQKIAVMRETFASFVEIHPKVLLLQMIRFPDIYLGNYTYGNCSPLLKKLGFQLVSPPGFDDVKPEPWAPISLETLPQLNDADLVIILGRRIGAIRQLDGTDHFEENQISHIKQAWEENSIAQSLDASKAGQVYFIPYHLCTTLPGPIGTELYLEELQEQLLLSN